MVRSSTLVAVVAAFASTVTAQTSTTCNPLNETCPVDPALGTSYTWNFSSTSKIDSDSWNITNGVMNYTDDALGFTINKKLDSPTIKSNFYIFFGRMEYHVRAAPGQGVISSVVLESDDLDEIDWEWVGSQGDQVQLNWFGKGATIVDSEITANLSSNATLDFHNYTTWWDSDKLEWWYDGTLLRTLTYDDATNSSGTWYPQTPATIRIGIWAGGDPSEPEGTIEWAGGEIDYDAAPYTMYLSQVMAHDFSTGKEYNYTNRSGEWQSIDVIAGNSTIEKKLYAAPAETLAQKWDSISEGGRIGIIAGASCAVGLGALAGLFACIHKRRVGKREWNIQNNQWTEERTEMMNMQAEWRQKGYVEVK